jgi:hypothetical protein
MKHCACTAKLQRIIHASYLSTLRTEGIGLPSCVICMASGASPLLAPILMVPLGTRSVFSPSLRSFSRKYDLRETEREREREETSFYFPGRKSVLERKLFQTGCNDVV